MRCGYIHCIIGYNVDQDFKLGMDHGLIAKAPITKKDHEPKPHCVLCEGLLMTQLSEEEFAITGTYSR